MTIAPSASTSRPSRQATPGPGEVTTAPSGSRGRPASTPASSSPGRGDQDLLGVDRVVVLVALRRPALGRRVDQAQARGAVTAQAVRDVAARGGGLGVALHVEARAEVAVDQLAQVVGPAQVLPDDL